MTLISKEERNKIVEYFKNKWESGKISKKSLGIIMRSFHMSAPIFFILIASFAPKKVVWVVLFLLLIIFLSMIEHKICDDDFTIADPFLELLEWEKNSKNRFNVTLLIGFFYYVIIGIIYYTRFL
jgi:hypothetical protein